MNKDFYNNLPGMVCVMLDDLIEKYNREEWFEKAWEEYRQHVLSNSMNDMKMPGYIFNKYLKEQTEKELIAKIDKINEMLNTVCTELNNYNEIDDYEIKLDEEVITTCLNGKPERKYRITVIFKNNLKNKDN